MIWTSPSFTVFFTAWKKSHLELLSLPSQHPFATQYGWLKHAADLQQAWDMKHIHEAIRHTLPSVELSRAREREKESARGVEFVY